MQKSLLQKREELKVEVCRLMCEKETFLQRYVTGGDVKKIPSIQAQKKEVENQLRRARAICTSAKNSKQLLADLKSSQSSNVKEDSVSQDGFKAEFESQLRNYVELITKDEALREQLKSKKAELISLKKEVSRLETEVAHVTGRNKAPRNPWTIGVPYGL